MDNSNNLIELCRLYQTTDRKIRPNKNNLDGFLPCPFCNTPPHIRIEDDEGNCKDWDPSYEKDPWSGLWYVIEHTRDMKPDRLNRIKNIGDIPWNKPCLIATNAFDWYGLGSVPNIGGNDAVFSTRKDAVDWWNKLVLSLY